MIWNTRGMVLYQEFSVSSLQMARWSFSSRGSQVGHGEWKSILLSICTTSSLPPWHHFHEPTEQEQRWLGKETRIQRLHLVHLISEILLCWGHSLMCIHNEHKYYLISIQKHIYISIPHTSNYVLSRSIMNKPNNCYCYESEWIYISNHLSFQAK